LPVYPRADSGALLRCWSESPVGLECNGVYSVEDTVVVDLASLKIDEEAGTAVNGSTDVSAVGLRPKGRKRRDGKERISRVPDPVADVIRCGAMKFIGTGLSEDFDASIDRDTRVEAPEVLA